MAAKKSSDLYIRIASAIVLLAIVLPVAWRGGDWFRWFAVLLAFVIYGEWLAMARTLNFQGLLHGLLLALVLGAMVTQTPVWAIFAILVAVLIIGRAYDRLTGGSPWPAAGVAYAGLAGTCLGLLRGEDMPGLYVLLFLFATVWATDIAAYFVGRAVGGPKLARLISPGKTWSGALGGAVAGTLAGIAVAFAAKGAVALLALAALSLSVVAQIGDLFESWVKRQHGAKDSSRLIPGHGGVMDRVDGLVAAAVILYVIAAIAGAPSNPGRALFPG
ncbi:MAG: phosphatidate cytidylyltransferase [Rhizobiaceae bacterium]|nr:phosphatidate cytidylyltransferase [Rhizobiaceae bacterium]